MSGLVKKRHARSDRDAAAGQDGRAPLVGGNGVVTGRAAETCDGLDASGYVLRARRRADLSQRDLAGELGLSQSAVARMERDACRVALATFEQVLGLGGMRLMVVDESGRPVAPFDPETVRDNGRRRFPAHLDVELPGPQPANRGIGERRDRPPAQAWYALRRLRDAEAEARGDRPGDHPTQAEVSRWWVEQREAWRRLRPAVTRQDVEPCHCPDACFESSACSEACGCQCEPANFRTA